MEERIKKELALLRQRYPELEYYEDGYWLLIPSYPLPEGWNLPVSQVAFQIPVEYPGAPPYGFYVPIGLLFNQVRPDNYIEPAKIQPPFQGTWGFFSWTTIDGKWRITNDLITGSNLLNWVMGFSDRFKDGK